MPVAFWAAASAPRARRARATGHRPRASFQGCYLKPRCSSHTFHPRLFPSHVFTPPQSRSISCLFPPKTQVADQCLRTNTESSIRVTSPPISTQVVDSTHASPQPKGTPSSTMLASRQVLGHVARSRAAVGSLGLRRSMATVTDSPLDRKVRLSSLHPRAVRSCL